MDQPRAYVHLAYGFGASAYRERYGAGAVPDRTPYGLHHAEEFGWKVAHSVDTPEWLPAAVFRRVLKRVLGFDLVHAYRNRRLIQAADIVWTMEEVSYLGVCALGIVLPAMKRPPIIAQTIWLFDRWDSYSALRRWALKRLLKRVDLLTFHSRNYLGIAKRLFPGARMQVLPFGISGETFPLTIRPARLHTPIRLLSMGNDATRDWPTLLAAFGGDSRFELRIVCRRVTDAMVVEWNNVECVRDPSMQGFRQLYAWADLVIVTMIPNLFSGITVALEAVGMGVPVIASDTGGIPTYFDADQVVYVPPENPSALRDAVLAQSNDHLAAFAERARQRFVREDYTTRGMASRYVAASRAILDGDAS